MDLLSGYQSAHLDPTVTSSLPLAPPVELAPGLFRTPSSLQFGSFQPAARLDLDFADQPVQQFYTQYCLAFKGETGLEVPLLAVLDKLRHSQADAGTLRGQLRQQTKEASKACRETRDRDELHRCMLRDSKQESTRLLSLLTTEQQRAADSLASLQQQLLAEKQRNTDLAEQLHTQAMEHAEGLQEAQAQASRASSQACTLSQQLDQVTQQQRNASYQLHAMSAEMGAMQHAAIMEHQRAIQLLHQLDTQALQHSTELREAQAQNARASSEAAALSHQVAHTTQQHREISDRLHAKTALLGAVQNAATVEQQRASALMQQLENHAQQHSMELQEAQATVARASTESARLSEHVAHLIQENLETSGQLQTTSTQLRVMQRGAIRERKATAALSVVIKTMPLQSEAARTRMEVLERSHADASRAASLMQQASALLARHHSAPQAPAEGAESPSDPHPPAPQAPRPAEVQEAPHAPQHPAPQARAEVPSKNPSYSRALPGKILRGTDIALPSSKPSAGTTNDCEEDFHSLTSGQSQQPQQQLLTTKALPSLPPTYSRASHAGADQDYVLSAAATAPTSGTVAQRKEPLQHLTPGQLQQLQQQLLPSTALPPLHPTRRTVLSPRAVQEHGPATISRPQSAAPAVPSSGKTDHCKEDAQPLAPGEPQQQQQLTRQALPPLAPMDSRALSPRVVQDHVRTSAVPSAPGSGHAKNIAKCPSHNVIPQQYQHQLRPKLSKPVGNPPTHVTTGRPSSDNSSSSTSSRDEADAARLAAMRENVPPGFTLRLSKRLSRRAASLQKQT